MMDGDLLNLVAACLPGTAESEDRSNFLRREPKLSRSLDESQRPDVLLGIDPVASFCSIRSLEKGTYDLVLHLDGYKTVSRQITVYPGTVIDINDHLEPGESTRPEDLVSKSTTRRDERLRHERERREELERGEGRRDDYGEDWRDRMRRQRGRDSDVENGRDRDRDRDEEMSDDDSSRRGRLRLEVEPEDASVYLDGRFVGTGREISLMRSGLPVSPGDHKLSIVRPGHRAEERDFTVEAGEDVELEIELESESR